MTEQQWNEFLDKLDFVHLSDRWELLPLHWLDEDLPDSVSELGRALVAGLLEARQIEDEEERKQRVEEIGVEYRASLAEFSLDLDSRLCPPASRVTLRFLNPQDLGNGDCLITTGAWDRLGYLVADLANPGGEHLENVGEAPVRQEPGRLSYRSLLLFPDKGTPSPRAFRSLCEKTLRQARSLGGRHFAMTHLHLPQPGLADRFGAAEVVSAVRQMLRDAPGTTVDILVFSHRNYQDYKHWFESLQVINDGSAKSSGYESAEQPIEGEAHDYTSEVVGSFKNFAKRSGELASGATASVSRWLKGSTEDKPATTSHRWREPSFEERRQLARLYLGRTEPSLLCEPNPHDGLALYMHALARLVSAETSDDEIADEERDSLKKWRSFLSESVADPHWQRYSYLLEWRLSNLLGESPVHDLEALARIAAGWDDRTLMRFLKAQGEDSSEPEANEIRPPVSPGGSRLDAEGPEHE